MILLAKLVHKNLLQWQLLHVITVCLALTLTPVRTAALRLAMLDLFKQNN